MNSNPIKETAMSKEKTAKPILPRLQIHTIDASEEPYKDNNEHLMALEMEARIILLSAQQGNLEAPWSSDSILSLMDKDDKSRPSPHSFALRLHEMQACRKNRERRTIARGTALLFDKVCTLYALDAFEHKVLMLLFVTAMSHSFKVLLSKSIFKEYVNRSGLEVGAILSILEPDFTRQIQKRSYFSADARLIRNEILFGRNRLFDPDESILDTTFYLHQRIANFILGDDNIYCQEMTCIEKVQSRVDLRHLVLPGTIKQTVIEQVSNYLQAAARRTDLRLDVNIGYGTGMVCLFHGPSGTGKTMLAHGLAQHFNMRLLIINMEKAREYNTEDIIKYAFKEARLTNSIVFFDECDDLFKEGTSDSRTLLIEIEKANCIIILATNKPFMLDPALARRIQLKLPILLPGAKEREHIWKTLVPQGIGLSPDVDFNALAQKYHFSGGLIKNAVMAALAKAIHEGNENTVTMTQVMLETAAQMQSNHSMQQIPIGQVLQPEHQRIDHLPLENQDKKRLRHLARCESAGLLDAIGKGTLILTQEISSALEALQAVAAESGQLLWTFTLSELFHIESKRLFINPLTHESIEIREIPFISLGQRTMTVFIDDHHRFADRLHASEAKGADLESLLNRLDASRKHIYVIAKSKPATRPIPGIARTIKIGQPSEITQAEIWKQHLDPHPDNDRLIHQMIERYPMHPGQIKKVCREARIRSMIEHGTDLQMNRLVAEVVCGLQINLPVLFGPEESSRLEPPAMPI
jgi:DNA polymerase III delta prime subunit